MRNEAFRMWVSTRFFMKRSDKYLSGPGTNQFRDKSFDEGLSPIFRLYVGGNYFKTNLSDCVKRFTLFVQGLMNAKK